MKKTNRSLLISAMSLLLCLSMLVGSTFAWFTDEATAGVNQILAGELDVGMDYWNGTAWVSVDGESLFPEDLLWEPGHTEVVYLRISNLGNLALKYRLGVTIAEETGSTNVLGETFTLSQYIRFGAVEAQPTFASRDAARAALSESQLLTAGYTKTGSIAANEGAQYVALVVYMPESVGNEANHMAGVAAPTIKLGIDLIATQAVGESDSFDNNYDANAAADFFPGFQGGTAGATVSTNDQGVTTADVDMAGGDVSAVIPAGVLLANGVDSLELSVAVKDASEANIQLSESEKMSPLDVHIEGVGAGNTVPMLITLEQYLTTGINTGALRLYHVENGTSVAMTQVANPTNHNEFSYDPLTGNLTLALASFSEVAVVADTTNTWNGEAEEWTGSGEQNDPYLIATAGHMAYFRNLVDGGNSFEGEFVKLNNSITLSNVNFDPIGWGYEYNDWNVGDVAGKPFKGTFDGNGKVILDLYQSGWDLTNAATGEAYTYTNCGFGLFAAAAGATFKNLTIYGANIRVECVEVGILVGLSQGSCTYDNITIANSKVANYQRPTGGLIGEISPLNGSGKTKITNVVIGSDVVVGSLWGDFDAPCGGVIGARWDDSNTTTVEMKDVTVGCRMDVYSDVTSAYQWYAYRRAGMLIGNTEQTVDGNEHLADARFLTCVKDDEGNPTVKVYYGDWAAYHYCQFTNQDNTWCNNYPWVRVEAGENCSAYSNPRYGQPVIGGVAVTTDNHTCTGDNHNTELRFNQLYGGGQGVYGQPVHDGVEVVNYRYSITYVNDYQVLAIKYVTENGAVSTANSAAQDLVVKWANENIGEGKFAFGGWMNAGSTKLTQIDANNTKNIVLYPWFNDPYTARFVDQQGNVIAYCFFHKEDTTKLDAAKAAAEAALPSPGEDFVLTWEVNANGTKVEYNKSNFANYKYDVTVYPVYKYTGNLKLTPVDENSDGTIEYYKVEAVGTLDEETVIPGYVNGIPVKLVEKLYKNDNNWDFGSGVKTIIIEEGVEELARNSLGYTADLTTVKLPSTLTTLGKNTFSRNLWYNVFGDKDTKKLQIVYNGTKAEWDKLVANSDTEWANGLKEGTTVECIDGTYTATSVNFETSNHKWTWTAKSD